MLCYARLFPAILCYPLLCFFMCRCDLLCSVMLLCVLLFLLWLVRDAPPCCGTLTLSATLVQLLWHLPRFSALPVLCLTGLPEVCFYVSKTLHSGTLRSSFLDLLFGPPFWSLFDVFFELLFDLLFDLFLNLFLDICFDIFVNYSVKTEGNAQSICAHTLEYVRKK